MWELTGDISENKAIVRSLQNTVHEFWTKTCVKTECVKYNDMEDIKYLVTTITKYFI